MDVSASKKLQLSLLIIRAQSGSKSAFRLVYERFSGVTTTYLSQLVSIKDVDDIAQQVWFKVYQQLHTLSSPYGFKQWLMRITHRIAIDHLTKENKYQDLASKVSDLAIGSDLSEPSKMQSLPYHDLYGAIDDLSIDHKEVIMLFYWQDFSCTQIAQILCCSSGTVKSRLFNARELLEKKKQITSYRKEMANE